MNKPFINEEIEIFARRVADAINTEDAELYAHLMEHGDQLMRRLKRWELLALKDRVHYLADNPEPISDKI